MATLPEDNVCIVVGDGADALVRFAAEELSGYLKRLFGVSAAVVDRRSGGEGPCFYVGLIIDAHVREACRSLPDLSDQGILVRRTDSRTMVLAGGSGAATAWAVYELVERYGVRYLLHGDVFPDDPGPFHLPDVDLVMEPVLRLRSWRHFNDLPTGPAMWSLAQQRAIIRQIFKLKFNSVYLCLWPQHPFVDYEVGGIRRQTGCLLFGQKIPIDSDTIGAELLFDGPFLDNPDLKGASTFPEKLEAGRRLIGGILEQAEALGMHRAINIQPLEFPTEFRPLLQKPTVEEVQLGDLTCAEQGDLLNPGHVKLAEAVVSAYLEQWGQVDELYLGMPEHPQAGATFRTCWQELDRKYDLESTCPLADMLERASQNHLIPGGLERGEREFKSAISMLHFYDRFLKGSDLLQKARDTGIDIHLNLGLSTEPLYPILDRVLWEGGGISTTMGYTASRTVRRMRAMEELNADRVPAALIISLQDDNVGWLPQVATGSIHLLMERLKDLGWRGFQTRSWPIGDLDPTTAYMARSSWERSVTPDTVYLDHFTHVYGVGAADGLCQVMRLMEDATVILDLDFLSLFFPVLGIMCRSLGATTPMPEGLFHVRAMYEEVQRRLGRIAQKVRTEAGREELAYWRARIEFSLGALIEKGEIHEAGVQMHAAKQSEDAEVKGRHLREAERLYGCAIEAGERGLQAMVGHIRDDSDRACVAAYYHFFVREVREKAAEMLTEASAR